MIKKQTTRFEQLKRGISDEHKIAKPPEGMESPDTTHLTSPEHKHKDQHQPVKTNAEQNPQQLKNLANAWNNSEVFTLGIRDKIIEFVAGTAKPDTGYTPWKTPLFTLFQETTDHLSVAEKKARAFFQNKEFLNQAIKARKLYEDGDMEGALALVRACPALLYYPVTMADDRGTKRHGTLLQVAAMDYDFGLYFDPYEPKENEKSWGMVERIIDLGKLPIDEITKQLDAVLPCDWNTMTEKRWRYYGIDPKDVPELRQRYDAELKSMLHCGLTPEEIEKMHQRGEDELLPWQLITTIHMQPYKDACDRLKDGIVELFAHTYDQLKIDCKDIIDEFYQIVSELRERPVRRGLVFDPALFLHFTVNTYYKNNEGLGGCNSIASILLWNIACGTLQKTDTQSGRDVHFVGVYKVAIEAHRPERGAGKIVPDGLGDSFIYSIYNGACGVAWPDWPFGSAGRALGGFSKLMSIKNGVIARMCAYTATASPNPADWVSDDVISSNRSAARLTIR